MNIDVELIEKVVKKVLNDVETGSSESEYGYGIFDTKDEAIEASAKAQKEYMNHSMADRQRYVEGIREVVCTKENLEYMSKLAVEESGMGAYEYKVIKNRLAAVKSPGVEDLTTEALSGDDGLTLVEYCPFGVIGAIAPTTNPTETVICNSIAMLFLLAFFLMRMSLLPYPLQRFHHLLRWLQLLCHLS